MKKQTTFTLLLIFVVLILALSSCDSTSRKPNADKQIAIETEIAMQEANRQVGMPGITNFTEKKMLKQLYELRDQEDLICYAYYFNTFEGKRGDFIGKCIGYGLPYSTQFSNPQTYKDRTGSHGAYGIFMPQPEPNGLFMPEGLDATWLMLINPETNTIHPVYCEPTIIVSPFKLH